MHGGRSAGSGPKLAADQTSTEWEYLTEPLKVSSLSGHLLIGDLDDLGQEGWELIKIMPLPEPDPKGVFDTTIGAMVLRRPDCDRREFHYEALTVDEPSGPTGGAWGRFHFGGRDKLGRQGWELVRIEMLPQPDRPGFYETTVGIQVFRAPA